MLKSNCLPNSYLSKVAELLGIDCEWMITYFCKPKLKVGTEWVQKGSTCSNAAQSVSGIARAIYERTFRITVSLWHCHPCSACT